jgi:hypothetical protein
MPRLWYSLQSGKSYKSPEEVDRRYRDQAAQLMERGNAGKLEMLMKKLRGEE